MTKSMIDLPCNTSQQQKWSGLKNTLMQTYVLIYLGTQLLISTAIQIMLANTSKTLVHLNSSRILCIFGEGPVNAATYSFGAPGHGKGVYDGLGGSMKTKVHNLIQGSKTGQAIPGVQSGYINNVEDVYDALRHYFQSDHASICKWSRNPIDMFQLFKYVGNHNPI